MTPTSQRRRTVRLLTTVATAVCLVGSMLAVAPAASADSGATTMTFTGRGWGHGRGMSQWGAQGYASVHGWDYRTILGHYYGQTTVGTADSTSNHKIRLERLSGRSPRMAITNGSLKINGVPTAYRTIELVRDGGQIKVYGSTDSGCSGPLTHNTTSDGVVTIDKHAVSDSADPDDHIRICPVASNTVSTDNVTVWYPGAIESRVVAGTLETMNITTMEEQLRSTVPAESPASWHLEALKAQAVAARSYALAGDNRWTTGGVTWAHTCDTTTCQVYLGHFTDRPGEASRKITGRDIWTTTDTRTDAAIAGTHFPHTGGGEVRIRNGAVARTEFSSTSGGHTAGGTFPAVPDAGDVISPLHVWPEPVTVPVTSLETAHGGGSRLVEIEVLQRNGLGADGGRVLTARLHFANGTKKDVSGDAVRSALGLRSNWFTPLCGVESRYIEAVHGLFLSRSATGGEIEFWCGAVRQGQQGVLTHHLSVSNEWAGVQINGLYQKILGRQADSAGRAYWLGLVAAGMKIEEIAAQFYGSAEYLLRAGNTNAGFVDRLYRDLLGRAPDSGGLAYWTSVLQSGQATRTAVAGSFYLSIESRRDRVVGLYQTILGRNPDTAGRDYWVALLPQLGDVTLAAQLAASQEYYLRSLT